MYRFTAAIYFCSGGDDGDGDGNVADRTLQDTQTEHTRQALARKITRLQAIKGMTRVLGGKHAIGAKASWNKDGIGGGCVAETQDVIQAWHCLASFSITSLQVRMHKIIILVEHRAIICLVIWWCM